MGTTAVRAAPNSIRYLFSFWIAAQTLFTVLIPSARAAPIERIADFSNPICSATFHGGSLGAGETCAWPAPSSSALARSRATRLSGPQNQAVSAGTTSAPRQTEPSSTEPSSTEPSSTETSSTETGKHQTDDSPHRLVWNFPRFRTWQYIATAITTAGNITVEIVKPKLIAYDWRKPFGYELDFRNVIVADSREGRLRAALISDAMWYSILAYPVVIDSILIPLATDDWNFDVATQMVLLDWQVLSIAGLVTRAFHSTIGRARPSVHSCADADPPCPQSGDSFYSGHVAMTAAGAGLACAHHFALPLYGEGPAGAIVCGTLSAGALAVGSLRMVADKHWVTDVIVGELAGFGMGLGLPWLLQYQYEFTEHAFQGTLLQRSMLFAEARGDAYLLSLMGLF